MSYPISLFFQLRMRRSQAAKVQKSKIGSSLPAGKFFLWRQAGRKNKILESRRDHEAFLFPGMVDMRSTIVVSS